MLYRWLDDPSLVQPIEVDAQFAARLADVDPTEDLLVELSVTTSQFTGGQRVAVAVAGEDVLLAADENDGAGWRIVGGTLARFGAAPWFGDPIQSVLVIGSDARWNEDVFSQRADSIHIVTAVADQSAGAIVGIPRDSYMPNPNGSNRKVNGVLAGYGAEGVVETIQTYSGMEIDGYIITGFLGFSQLIEGFGPFEIFLPQAIRGGLPGFRNFPEGDSVIEGDDVLLLARIRKTLPQGDFDRSFNHGVIMKAVLDNIQTRSIRQLPMLLGLLNATTHTDLSAAELLRLGAVAYYLDNDLVTNHVLPGRAGRAGEASVVFLSAGADELLADLADDGLINSDQ